MGLRGRTLGVLIHLSQLYSLEIRSLNLSWVSSQQVQAFIPPVSPPATHPVPELGI